MFWKPLKFGSIPDGAFITRLTIRLLLLGTVYYLAVSQEFIAA